MKINLEFSKAEIDLVLRGISDVLADEHNRGWGLGLGQRWKETKKLTATLALEAKIKQAIEDAVIAKVEVQK